MTECGEKLGGGVAHVLAKAPVRSRTGLFAALVLTAGAATTRLGYAGGRAHVVIDAWAVPELVPERRDQLPVSLRQRLSAVALLLSLPLALALWLISLRDVPLDRMTDVGLVSVLPPEFWLALALLTISFCRLIRRPGTPQWLLAAHVLSLIAIMHATPVLLYESLRYPWSWKQVGVIDYFMRRPAVDESIHELSAFLHWPGFFTLNALLVKTSGFSSALSYASWGPPFFETLLLGPLLLIFRAFTDDRRLVWSAAWIFYLGAWVGQDYFSPQAYNFFLYLTVIAICLRWLKPRTRTRSAFRSAKAAPPIPSPVTGSAAAGRGERILMSLALLPLMATIASSHQLTPIMLISSLVVLVTFCRYRVGVLALTMIAFTVAWDLTFAWPFVEPSLQGVVQSIGSLGANTDSGFINLADASSGQVLVAQIDRAHSAAVWLLGIAGFCRRRRVRQEFVLVLLAIAPMLAIAVNDYGGEMLFRTYMFGLPFAAFFAAALFFPGPEAGRSGWTRAIVPAVLLMLIPGFAFSYYGKERQNYFSQGEIKASQYMFGIAPRGSLFVGATRDFPWAFWNFEFYAYKRFGLEDAELRTAVLSDPVKAIEELMERHKYHHAYVILTRSQAAAIDMSGIMPPGSLDLIRRALTNSPRFTVIYQSADAVVITLAEPEPGGAP